MKGEKDMSYKTIVINRIQVVGHIWQPGTVRGEQYDLKPHQVQAIKALWEGKLTREAVELWLATNSGDFQHVQDFHADIEDFDSPWENEENEAIFNDCMFDD